MGLMSAAYQDVKEYLLGAPDQNTDLYNYYNLQYYGPIYMGDNRETIDVVWDTGSFIYLAETDACSACDQSEAYDTSTSPSFNDLGFSYSQSYLDGTTLSGNFAIDSVCVADDASSCVSGFIWISVSESQLGGSY